MGEILCFYCGRWLIWRFVPHITGKWTKEWVCPHCGNSFIEDETNNQESVDSKDKN
jgi:predicted RNA-binding Zn-ribbon protein involved in translation (DUF1610 family)